MQFCKELKRRIKERGLTQREFAEKFNFSENSISQWSRGERRPDFETLVALARALGVSTDALLGLQERRQLSVDLEKLMQSIRRGGPIPRSK